VATETIVVQHSRPYVGEVEAEAARAVVLSGRLAQGRVARELEARWAEVTGAADAACVGSGTAALRLGLLGLGVGPGDEVIVPAYSCVALLNPVLALGATPVLADVELDRWTLSADDVRGRLTGRTRAIVAVHLFGAPARLADLAPLGVPVVEDCAHGGPFGDPSALSISSFYATKLIGAGEGGIVAAADPGLVERVRRARDYADQGPSGLHLNDKVSDLHAAVALAQLGRLPEMLALRTDRAAAYDERLEPLVERGLLAPPIRLSSRVWYRYAVRLLEHRAADVCARMASAGVRGEQPVWDLRPTVAWGRGLAAAETAFERLVSLPLYPDLTDAELEHVCLALEEALGR
jgi:perosamine synthetase